MSELDTEQVTTETPEIDPADFGAWRDQRQAELRDENIPESAHTAEAEPKATAESASEEPNSEKAKESESEEDADASKQEQESEQSDKDKGKPRGKSKQTANERIREVTRFRREAEAKARTAEEKAEKLEQRLAALETGKTETPNEKQQADKAEEASGAGFSKSPEDFPNYEEFIAAYTKFQIANAIDAHDAEKSKADQQAEHQRQAQAANEQWNSQLAKIEESHDDFEELIENLQMHEGRFAALQQAVLGLEDGDEVFYQILASQKLLEAVDAQPDAAGINRLVGKVQASIEQTKPEGTPTSTETPTKKPSKPPPSKPVEPVRGGGAGGEASVYNDRHAADYTAWRKTRRADLARKAR